METKEAFNKVVGWRLHVYEQSKIQTKSGDEMVKLRTTKSGKKIEGEEKKWEDPMFIDVLVNKNTTWPQADLTRKNITVDGTFSHSWFAPKEGDPKIQFTIFADKVEETTFK